MAKAAPAQTMTRRTLLMSSLPLAARPRARITGIELIPLRASERTVWLIVRLSTDAGVQGLGEASDGFGFGNTTREQAARMESELRKFFDLVHGASPLDVERYRQKAWPLAASGGLIAATAFSSIEQAMWDISGQLLGVPACDLLGGAVRGRLPAYANINRATRPRTPAGFAAAARKAVADGFQALKLAPFDGFPKPGSGADAIRDAVDLGIACVAAVRDAVGSNIDVMVDCHSFFDVPLSESVARRLEPFHLAWYEEPVAPERTADTLAIRKAIRQTMAGGEMLFGVAGFVPLCREKAVHVIMPDVKHCGGLLELTRIAAMAAAEKVEVAPHNPSGPAATAATVQVCAGMANFRLIEMQWGEAPWRGELLDPPESFDKGGIDVPGRPGFGVRLNERVARAHAA